MRQLALINGKTLKLLRESKRVTHEYLANKCGFACSNLQVWEQDLGQDFPTMRQAEKLAATLQVPFAGLYLEPGNIPDHALPNTKNMRRFPDGWQSDDSAVNLALDWLVSRRSEILDIRNELNIFSSRVELPTLSNNAIIAADQLRNYLGLTLNLQRRCKSSRQLYLLIRRLIEDKGVLLAQFHGVDLNDARGLSIYYEVMPIIGVNDDDRWPAMSFSAIHELTHLAKRASSLCNQMGVDASDSEEVFCNAIAGNFLVPATEMIDELDKEKASSLEEINRLASFFAVSSEVISRRLFDLGYLTKTQYERLLDYFDAKIREEREEEKHKREAGLQVGFSWPQEKRAADRFGGTYCEAILKGVEGGIYSEHEASAVFNVPENKLQEVFREALK